MAYSKDFRERAVAYKQAGHTFKRLKEAFGIPSETYYNWRKRLESGYYEIPVKRERGRKIDKEQLKQAVAENPDAFPRELAVPFNRTATAVHHALEKINITRKKSPLPIMKSQN